MKRARQRRSRTGARRIPAPTACHHWSSTLFMHTERKRDNLFCLLHYQKCNPVFARNKFQTKIVQHGLFQPVGREIPFQVIIARQSVSVHDRNSKKVFIKISQIRDWLIAQPNETIRSAEFRGAAETDGLRPVGGCRTVSSRTLVSINAYFPTRPNFFLIACCKALRWFLEAFEMKSYLPSGTGAEKIIRARVTS